MPWYPGDQEPGRGYTVGTSMEKLVADYARIPLSEVGGLDYIEYLELRRDAYISKLNATESGCEYLDKAWRFAQTDNDREKSRRIFGIREED